MSHSPDNYVSLDDDDPYVRANKSLSVMLAEGRSFSGNERNCCFLNTGGERFANVSAATGLDFIEDGRAVAPVDWDLDGDLDLWIANRNGPAVRFLRNDMTSGHRFVAIRPEGTTCNRDAIGTRIEIELDDPDMPLVAKTLHAGSGFGTQTSRWLHFGLGKDRAIKRCIAYWPDGSREEFSGVVAGGRFVLKQGTGTVRSWQAPVDADVHLVESDPSVPGACDSARVVAFKRWFLPDNLTYQSYQDDSVALARPDAGRHQLLVLWASWCPTCTTELQTLADNQRQLEQAGIEIVALSVDALDRRMATDGSEEEFLIDLGLKGQSGRATEALVATLEQYDNDLLNRWRPLPIPTSFLINSEGRLVALYKGPVDAELVVYDASLADRPVAERRDAAVPMAGRWGRPIWEPVKPQPTSRDYTNALFNKPIHLGVGLSLVAILGGVFVRLRSRRQRQRIER